MTRALGALAVMALTLTTVDYLVLLVSTLVRRIRQRRAR